MMCDGLNMTHLLEVLVDRQRAVLAMALAVCLYAAGASTFLLIQGSEDEVSSGLGVMFDPLLQDEGHDHRNASQHILYTDNIQPISFNPLTAPGNAEVQVCLLYTSPSPRDQRGSRMPSSA